MGRINSPDPNFDGHITKLELFSAAAAEACCMTGQRQWYYPPLNGWSGHPSDITGMNQAFDRTELNENYIEVVGDLNQLGAMGEATALKVQIDYIAALERSFRTRHMSSVRSKMHARGRKEGQGDSAGLFGNNVSLWVTRLLDAAHDKPVGPGY